MRVVHITEAMGGGVAHSLSQLAKAQAADGHEVLIVYSLRSDTPVDLLPELYPAPIDQKILPMVTPISPLADLKTLWQIYTLLRAKKPDVIHLHSSKAGILGRLAALVLGYSDRVFYSPRGFAFLRQDVSLVKKKLFLSLERIATKFGGTIVGCSATEVKLARNEVGHGRVCLVENCVDLSAVPSEMHTSHGRVCVVTSGRICYQKAPWRFREIAIHCEDLSANFIWLGDGDLLPELMVSGALPPQLQVVGWQPRAAVYASLAKADIFVLTSLWEGMPLALIEAQAAGLPAVVSDVVGNRDVVIDGETGFICKSDDELLDRVRMLVKNVDVRQKMAAAARKMATERFGVERMHRQMMSLYEGRFVA